MKYLKILLFGIVASFLIGSIQVSAATNPQDALVSVELYTYFDGSNQFHSTIDSQAYGSSVSFSSSLGDTTGYTFAFWILNGVVRYDLNLTDPIVLTGNQTITAVFKPVGEVVAAFMDSNGKLIDIQYLTPGQNAADIDLLDLPSKPGYVIASVKWNHVLTNIQADTIFTLQYEKVEDATFTITVTNGTGDGVYDYNTQATIVADTPSVGEYFNYWKIGNKIVGVESTLSFTVFENVTIEAVYSTTPRQNAPFLSLSSDLGIRVGYQSYIAKFYLPDGYSLIEHGMIVSESVGIIDIDSLSTTKYQSNTIFELTNEYLMSFSNASIQSVRAYMIVEDQNGNYMTIYNEVISEAAPAVYADDLFFSFYMEGSSNNKAISIFNGTESSVNLSEYTVRVYNNGASTPNASLTLTGTLASNSVYVIVNSSASTEIKAFADLVSSTVTSFNGNDAVTLEHTGALIDSIGQVGYDPGTEWVSGGVSTLNHSLTRKTSTISGDSNSSDVFDPSATWIQNAVDSTTDIDSFTMDGSGSGKTAISFDAYIDVLSYGVYTPLSLNNSYLRVYYDDGSSSIEVITQGMISNYVASVAGSGLLTVTYGALTDILNYQIHKINPTYTVPTFDEIELQDAMVLGDIPLPSGFSWEAPTTPLSLGTDSFNVTYTPGDTNVYLVVTGISVSITLVEVHTPILIYEVYGGGGNIGATYNQDYIVLYNNSASAIDLSTYSVQYASSSTYSVINLTSTLPSHGYYLIGLYSGDSGSALPVSPNLTSAINLVQTAGRIALVDNQVQISDMTDINVIDFVGYGNASEYETASTATTSSILSAKRISTTDTNDNSSDFSVSTPDLDYVASSLSIQSFTVHNLKAYYEQNEALSVLNAYLQVTYNNASTDNIPVTTGMISSFSTSSYGTFEMTVTYEGIIVSYEYHVIDYTLLDQVEIFYIDIGATGGPAGEAALIKIGGIEILIDAGEDDSLSEAALLQFLGTEITDGILEYVIATHPHSDHVGGMVSVFNAYSVTNVIQYSTSTEYVSATRLNYETAVASEGSIVTTVMDIIMSSSNVIEIIPGVTLTFFNTGYLTSADPNNSSIVFLLNAFDTTALFNGDAESDQEAVYAPLAGDIDVLKMGHHGSAAGTSTALLTGTTPNVVVVNDGNYLGNSYNHPTYSALGRVYSYSNNVPIYSVTGGNGSSSDRMLERNGTLTVSISNNDYVITSEYYGYNPMEISNTAYWDTINTSLMSGYYYATSTGVTTASILKSLLHNIIDDHHSVGYDLVDENLGITDEDPNNSNNVILFYTGRSQAKSTFGSTVDQWNREHIWAQSHGIDYAEPAYSDLHHLRPTDVSVNGARGNLDFGLVAHSSETIVNDTYGDVLTYNYLDGTYFEPRDEIKGDVARMLLYMAVRYEGDSGEPDLELVNGVTTTDSSNIGDLASLLQWCIDDPVDQSELLRNEAIYLIQGNRNPFIDHPELIYILYASELGV